MVSILPQANGDTVNLYLNNDENPYWNLKAFWILQVTVDSSYDCQLLAVLMAQLNIQELPSLLSPVGAVGIGKYWCG